MKAPENAVAVIFAHDEASWMGRVLEPLARAKREGLFSDILVVDDGSSDGTGQLARDHGATVLRHEKRSGKGAGFITAAKKAEKMGADIMFMTDADMTNLDYEKTYHFITKIMGQGDIGMVRSRYDQPSAFPGVMHECELEISGFRALRMADRDGNRVVERLLGEKLFTEGLGTSDYSLEPVLEAWVPEDKKRQVTGLGLESRTYGGVKGFLSVDADIRKTIGWVDAHRQEIDRARGDIWYPRHGQLMELPAVENGKKRIRN